MKKLVLVFFVVLVALLLFVAMAEAKYKIAFVPKLIGIPYFNAMEEGGQKGSTGSRCGIHLYWPCDGGCG